MPYGGIAPDFVQMRILPRFDVIFTLATQIVKPGAATMCSEAIRTKYATISQASSCTVSSPYEGGNQVRNG
jgi:hypothetical protein